MKKINVAIVGVGSCASALIQGVEYYKRTNDTIGITYLEIGGYKVTDLEFVLGFDIDKRKVKKSLKEAIYALPNCNMRVIDPSSDFGCISKNAKVFMGKLLDGVSPHMLEYPEEVSFRVADEPEITSIEFQSLLKENKVDVLLNYLPVGSELASKFYIENAILSGVHIVNCIPSFISTTEMKKLELLAIENEVTIVGNDMRSQFGASRLSEILQGSMLDNGLEVTQHIQTNMAAGNSQGDNFIGGRTANTDFLNMSEKSRLHNKHISKENVLKGQNIVREKNIKGQTLFAGPSLTVLQKPGGVYKGTDTKIANLDIIAYGWAGAKYELTARLVVQDSPNSAGIVADAVRFCKVAQEMGIVGFLRGVSARTQKTPPKQMTTAEAILECDLLAKREFSEVTKLQRKEVIKENLEKLEFSFNDDKLDY